MSLGIKQGVLRAEVDVGQLDDGRLADRFFFLCTCSNGYGCRRLVRGADIQEM